MVSQRGRYLGLLIKTLLPFDRPRTYRELRFQKDCYFCDPSAGGISMNVRSASLGAGAISFFRKKTWVSLNGATVRGTRAQHPTGNNQLLIAPSDFLLVPPAEQGQVPCDPFAQAASAYFSKGCQIVGQALFEGSIRIDGQVEGAISAKDRITVGQSGAIITADPIKAAEVIVQGTVRGNIVASERIEICASADVVGNLCAPIIAIEAGAVVEGSCSTTPRQKTLFRTTNRILPPSSEKM
jgi:cytoskeletal protein CcmA (bactofilin family)